MCVVTNQSNRFSVYITWVSSNTVQSIHSTRSAPSLCYISGMGIDKISFITMPSLILLNSLSSPSLFLVIFLCGKSGPTQVFWIVTFLWIMVHNLIVFCGLQIFKSSKNYHIQIIFVLHVRWQRGEQAVFGCCFQYPLNSLISLMFSRWVQMMFCLVLLICCRAIFSWAMHIPICDVSSQNAFCGKS